MKRWKDKGGISKLKVLGYEAQIAVGSSEKNSLNEYLDLSEVSITYLGEVVHSFSYAIDSAKEQAVNFIEIDSMRKVFNLIPEDKKFSDIVEGMPPESTTYSKIFRVLKAINPEIGWSGERNAYTLNLLDTEIGCVFDALSYQWTVQRTTDEPHPESSEYDRIIGSGIVLDVRTMLFNILLILKHRQAKEIAACR